MLEQICETVCELENLLVEHLNRGSHLFRFKVFTFFDDHIQQKFTALGILIHKSEALLLLLAGGMSKGSAVG